MRLDPWPFVAAAYAIMVITVGVLALLGWRAMRRAEAALEASREA